MRPLLILFIAAGLVLTIIGYRRLGDEHARVKYRLDKVQSGTLVSAVGASGTLKPGASAFVSAETAGQVKEVLADVNQEVKAGQVLARLDPDFAQACLDSAQAELDAARQAIEITHHQVDRARDEADNALALHASADADAKHAEVAAADAGRDLARKRKLMASDDVAPVDTEHSKSAYDSANAGAASAKARTAAAVDAFAAAEEDSRVAQAQLNNAEATVAVREAVVRQAQLDLDRTLLRSPIDGVVVERHAVVGQTIGVGANTAPLFVIAGDLRRLQLHASVAEADIGRVAVGQPATFVFDAFLGQTFSGQVTEIWPQPESSQTVVVYEVVITADNAERKLLPGMTADVHIVVGRRDDVLKVPNAALRFKPAIHAVRAVPDGFAGAQVWRLDRNGQPYAIQVHTGLSDGVFTEIEATDHNLANGDDVVVGATQSPDKSAGIGPLKL